MTKYDELVRLMSEGKELALIAFDRVTPLQKIQVDTWINSIKLFAQNQLEKDELKQDFLNACFFREAKGLQETYQTLTSLLISLGQYWGSNNNMVENRSKSDVQHRQLDNKKDYDLFLSHANADKLDYVDDLYKAFKKLGINIFYDKEELEWGDKWKEKILAGTAQSEFAVIVISENFFDREWTEKELSEFLNRQNASGQKIVLPLLYKIDVKDLQAKYPAVADIQALRSDKQTVDEICILFARQLIKRLKGII